jgi:cytochrome c oxidase assembly factor CtaG
VLTPVVAHAGVNADVWRAWLGEPLAVLAIVAVTAVYLRGRRRIRERLVRDASFLAGLAVVAVALASPLEHLSGELASAHMAQHLLLVVGAAPLLILARPFSTLARGAPGALVWITSARGRLGLSHRRTRTWLHPITLSVVHIAVLWVWHNPILYDAAVRNPWVHALEHASFLGTALLFWSAIRASVLPEGGKILLLFALAMQGVALAVLLVFAPAPWYGSYASSTAAWGLTPLDDQQLAGALMWVPGGAAYVGAALLVVASWLRDVERGRRRVAR